MNTNLEKLGSRIEATLFWKGEPVTYGELGTMLHTSEDEIKKAVDTLEKKLDGRGVQLMKSADAVELRTAEENSSLIENLTKEELSRDIGKAGLETLSIIIYMNPTNKRDIEYIRGVNSSFILRNLLIRGLIEKKNDPRDQRAFLYSPTFELLSFLGVTSIENLPQYSEIRHELLNFKKEQEKISEGKADFIEDVDE